MLRFPCERPQDQLHTQRKAERTSRASPLCASVSLPICLALGWKSQGCALIRAAGSPALLMLPSCPPSPARGPLREGGGGPGPGPA